MSNIFTNKKAILLISGMFILIFCFAVFYYFRLSKIDRIGNANSKVEGTYQATNQNITQTVKVEGIEKLNFELLVKNETDGKFAEMKGVAERLVSENTAIIGDEEGFGHFADEYVYKQGDCWIYITVDNETGERLSVMASPECDQISGKSAPFGSLGLLKKK